VEAGNGSKEAQSVLRFELVGGDEGAVEPEGHAGRQLDGGLEAHVGGIDDEELGAAGALVVHEGEDVPVVLAAQRGGGGVHGHEEGLAAEAALAVLELGELARGEVDLGEPGHLGPRLGDGEVGIARLAAQQVAVDHADLEVHLLRRRQDGAACGAARARVEADLGEHALESLVRLVEDGVGGGHAGADDHDLVGIGLLPRVPEVEAEAVGDVHPHHLRGIRSVFREHAEPRRLLLVEHDGGAAAEHLLELEDDLVVGDDDEVLGDCKVVDHGRLVERDLDVVRLGAVGAEVEVLEVRPLDDVVAERVELAGGRVELWVRDHGAAELSVEVVPSDGLEVAVVGHADVVGQVVLGHGEESAVEVDEARVGDAGAARRVDEAARGARVEECEARDARVAVQLADGLGEDGAADLALLPEPRRLREPARVRLGGAVADPQRVHHAVAVEQVVARHGVEAGVGAVARVHAVDEGGDAARDRELVDGQALADRREVAGDLDRRVNRLGQPVGTLQHAGHEPFLERVERRRCRALEEVELPRVVVRRLPWRGDWCRSQRANGGLLMGRRGAERRPGREPHRSGGGSRRDYRRVAPVYGDGAGRGETLHRVGF
jgi:hypothetical protein